MAEFTNRMTEPLYEQVFVLVEIVNPPGLSPLFPNLRRDDIVPTADDNWYFLKSRLVSAMWVSYRRRLCVTKNGYVGLVPPLTQCDDDGALNECVCICFGGDAPYLVRPTGDNWS